ncbi:unnamed protein product, partial [Gadus morhua 'NCC']
GDQAPYPLESSLASAISHSQRRLKRLRRPWPSARGSRAPTALTEPPVGPHRRAGLGAAGLGPAGLGARWQLTTPCVPNSSASAPATNDTPVPSLAGSDRHAWARQSIGQSTRPFEPRGSEPQKSLWYL